MNKQILRLAIPNIISNITVPLLGMVDMFIVGHLSSEVFIGSIAIAVMIFNFIYWSFSFLRMGTSGFTAQAFGASNKQEVINILLRSLTVAAIVAVLIILLQNVILSFAFMMIDASDAVKSYAGIYFHIYVWAAPAILGIYALTGWYVGMQDAKTPMFIAIFINAVNIILSLLFVFVFNMEIEGVALASAIAQLSGFILSLGIWNFKYKSLRKYIHLRFIKNISDFLPFFKVNTNIFLRTMCLIIVTTFFTSVSAKMGDTVLAVNSLMMQLFTLFSYMMDGFAYAAEALTGRFIGERNPKMLRLMIKRLFMWGIGLTLFFTIGYFFFSEDILRFLTDKENVLATAKEYLGWILLIPVAGFSAFLWDGIFVGMTASSQMRNSMFIAMVIFFLVYYIFNPLLGNNALWFAFISYLCVRGIIQAIIFTRLKLKFGL